MWVGNQGFSPFSSTSLLFSQVNFQVEISKGRGTGLGGDVWSWDSASDKLDFSSFSPPPFLKSSPPLPSPSPPPPLSFPLRSLLPPHLLQVPLPFLSPPPLHLVFLGLPPTFSPHADHRLVTSWDRILNKVIDSGTEIKLSFRDETTHLEMWCLHDIKAFLCSLLPNQFGIESVTF